jgi:branched-chain amino acid transport system ATP-binding protein
LPEDPKNLLHINSLVTGYGKKQVVNEVTLDVAPGEIVALIGHNGAGKSTVLKAIFGLIPIWKGHIFLAGEEIQTPKPYDLLRTGVSYLPQGNRVFTDMTVLENLKIGGVTLSNDLEIAQRIERVFMIFPSLKAHLGQRAGTLSGGEKQMLALANALIVSPRLLLLDEPSLGLSLPLVSHAFERIQQISRESRSAVLVVEQKVREILKIADRVYVLRTGRISFSGPTDSLADDVKLREVFL